MANQKNANTVQLNGKTIVIKNAPVGVYRTAGSIIFDCINYGVIALAAFTTVMPILYIIFNSFATEFELQTRSMFVIPHTWSLDAYTYVFSSDKLIRAFANSFFITVSGTVINLFCTVTMAYPLSKKYLRMRTPILNLIIFSMFFSGGMIPGFLLVSSWLGMRNTYWAILLPGAISAYNMMIVKNFFQGIPQELEESANLDGCSDLMTLTRIVLPLSLPVLATFGLFYAVGHWNSYFSAMIYLDNNKMHPLQLILREIVYRAEASASDMTLLDPDFVEPPKESVKMAVIVVATVPIMCIYPFLQKYFVKGVMVGALKG